MIPWTASTTPPPSTPTKPAHPVAVSVDAAADLLLGKLKARTESGPWEVLLEPFGGGHLPTSTTLEDAIRKRVAGLMPPAVVRGLCVQLKGFRGGDVLMVVEGSL